MVGKILGNRYEIIEELGGGGMAIVYKGRDKFLNRLVTIKVLRPEFTVDKDFITRFQREAQAVARLSHPNIVSIYDVGQEEHIHYLVMEYVHGDNLKTLIKKGGPLNPERALHIVVQICKALQHAHENNIVHRDVKPHNILITYGGWAKLTDFGMAREVTAATLTYTDTIMGSVHYLSPEQARGQAVGPKSDLYSLGVVLYEMLTGVVPYQGDSPIAVAIKHIQEQPELPSKINPRITPWLEKVILKALSKDPGFRFASASEMGQSLQAAIGKEDDPETEAIAPGEVFEEERNPNGAGKRRRLRPLGWVLAGLFFVAFLAAGAFMFNKYYLSVPEIQVPDVVNKSLAEATAILTGLGLRVAVVKDYDLQVPEGYVIRQDIGPQDPKVKPHRQVTLTVSLGPDLREVPDLYQLSVQEARIRLAEAGLQMAEQFQEDYHDKVPRGYIFHQEPRAHSSQPKGTIVTVYLSKGPRPEESRVPDLAGLTIEQARTRLSEAKLKLDESIVWTENGQYFSGQIVSQEPAANTPVQEGTAVKVVVSKGPGPLPRKAEVNVTVPNDGRRHQVRINVTDVRGSKDVYIKTHAPGEEFTEVIEFYGKTTIRVYLDNNLSKTKTYG
ncbi:MAG: protein kinase [Bacillota bacterium]